MREMYHQKQIFEILLFKTTRKKDATIADSFQKKGLLLTLGKSTKYSGTDFGDR